MEIVKKYKKYILVGIICLGLLLLFIPRSSNSDQLVVKGDKSKIEKTEKQKDAVEICFERIRAELMKKDEIIAELQAKIKKLESAQNMNYQKSMPDQTLSYKQAA